MTEQIAQNKQGEQKCGVEGCKRPYRAKGYCDFHFKKWKKGELPHGPYKTCLESGCRKPRKASGLCEDHEKSKLGKGGEAAPTSTEAKPATEAPKAEAAKEAPPAA